MSNQLIENEGFLQQCWKPWKICCQGCMMSCQHFKSACELCFTCMKPCFIGCSLGCKYFFECFTIKCCNPLGQCCQKCCQVYKKCCYNCLNESCFNYCEFQCVNLCMIQQNQLDEVSQLLGEFYELGDLQYKLYGENTQVLRHKLSQEIVAMKSYFQDDKDKAQELLIEYQNKMRLKHLHIIQIRYFAQRKTQSLFCTDMIKSIAICDYVGLDLQNELETRTKEQDDFKEPELWNLSLALLSSLLYLSQCGIDPNTVWISTKHIYITQTGLFKIQAPSTFKEDEIPLEYMRKWMQFISQSQFTFGSWGKKNLDYYLAPEQIDVIFKQLIKSYNKAITWLSFLQRCVILSMGCQSQLDNIYNFKKFPKQTSLDQNSEISHQNFMDQQALQGYMDQFYQKYSIGLTQFVQKLIEWDSDQRIDIYGAYKELLSRTEVKQIISKLQSEYQSYYISLLVNPNKDFQNEQELLQQQINDYKKAQEEQPQQIIIRIPSQNSPQVQQNKYDLQEVLKSKGYILPSSKGQQQNAFQKLLESKGYEVGFKSKPLIGIKKYNGSPTESQMRSIFLGQS